MKSIWKLLILISFHHVTSIHAKTHSKIQYIPIQYLVYRSWKSCGDYATSSTRPVSPLTIANICQQPLSRTATALLYHNARRLSLFQFISRCGLQASQSSWDAWRLHLPSFAFKNFECGATYALICVIIYLTILANNTGATWRIKMTIYISDCIMGIHVFWSYNFQYSNISVNKQISHPITERHLTCGIGTTIQSFPKTERIE